MHLLILFMIVAVTMFRYLVGEGYLPRLLAFTPELLSLAVGIYVLAAGLQNRFQYVRPVYWLIFAGLVVSIIVSAMINQIQPGVLFAGARSYLRAMPFFLLPAVLLITDKQLRLQHSVVLAVCAVQLVVAGEQRLWAEERGRLTGAGWASGDFVMGTLMASGLLTLFLIGVACVLTGFYVRRQLSGGRYLFLLFLVLIPTTLNETKITLFLLPMALLTVFVLGAKPGARLKNVAIGILVTGAFLAIFIPIYDYFMIPRWGYGLIDFLTMEGRAETYLTAGAQVGDEGKVGTLDGTLAAWAELYRDPMRLIFGVGIGNASHSALGIQFTGEYFRLFQHLPMKTFTYLLLEHGLLGGLFIFLLHCFIFFECIRLAQTGEDVLSALALGWCGVSVVIAAGLIYSEMIASEAISYLYWYLSGVIVAARMRQDLRKDTPGPVIRVENGDGPAERRFGQLKGEGSGNV